MDFEQLGRVLAQALGVEHLTPNDAGDYVLEFDGWLEVRISQLSRDIALFQAIVGRCPGNDFEARAFLTRVLSYSLVNITAASEVTSLDPDSNAICLHRTMDLRDLSVKQLEEALEQFTNACERWTNLLADGQATSTTIHRQHVILP